jgi:hypothetical protein
MTTFQRTLKSTLAKLFSLSLLSLSIFALGCSAVIPSNAPVAAPQFQGHVHGGQQPVSGAAVQLYAAGTTGYGIGAVSLLSTPTMSDANGNFTITGASPCPSSTSQLYIVATGGNPGLSSPTNNASLALMAAIGPCIFNGTQYISNPNLFVNVDEVTTVASVYALAGFIDPSTSQIGASASNSIGIANAFKTAPNLVNITAGQSLATTPAGNGTVPQAEINTLADIIATCVNSSGSGPECSALFTAATPSGGSAPTNTLQAMFNIATHPSQQVGALYALFSPTSPFQPTLPSTPNDWTIHVTYTAYGSTQTGIAVDGSGNVWIANESASSVTELATDGTILSGPAGYTGGGLNRPIAIAIDPLGNVWLTNTFGGLAKLNNVGIPLSGSTGFPVCGVGLAIDGFGNVWCGALGHVSKIDNNGNLLSGTGYPGGGLGTPIGASVDPLNNVWFTSTTAFNVSNVAKFTNVGVPLSGTTGYTATGLTNAWSIANDSAGNTWVTDNSFIPFSKVFRFATDGTNLSGPNGYTGGGLENPLAIAIDGAGNAWVTSDSISTSSGVAYNSVVQFGPDGTLLSGATGYSLSTNGIAGGLPVGIAIDGSGNVWVAASGTNVIELVGAATPVVTPLSVGVKTNALGARP